MPKRTSIYQLFPWQGGLNTSLDEALLPPGQLTIADHCIFEFQSAKKKRPGIDYDWDDSVFTVTHRSSSGTSRTLTGTFTHTGIVSGDKITIENASNTSYNVAFGAVTVSNATTITYTAVGSLTEGSTVETAATWGQRVLCGKDYWIEASGAKSQAIVTILDNGAVYYTVAGTRTRITDAGTAWTVISGLENASMEVFNNKLFIAVTGSGNKLKYWDGTTLGNSLQDTPNAPLCSVIRAHQGRLITNDKTTLDRWNFSQTGDHTIWNGTGDSGGGYLGIGDGDPSGVVGIAPTFKGDLFIGKRTKLYRITGVLPDFKVDKVSDGIGFVSHNAIAPIDQDDVVFASTRGIHSLAATDAYGSFSSSYVSNDIQRSFVQNWEEGRKTRIQSAYLPEINSVAFSVTDNSIDTDGDNNAVWLFNYPLKAWYRWPNVSCESLFLVQDTDKQRLYFGGINGRLAQSLTGQNSDTDENGVDQAILFRVATGLIFPDNSPATVKSFVRLGVMYKPQGSSTITAKIKVDNFSIQTLAFTEASSTDLMGTTFILGQSSLGSGVVLAPYALPIDGIGRGCKITIEQSGLNEIADIQGVYIEYVVYGDQQETRLSDSS